MGNLFTYLDWRGDLTFQERPFCEVDNLALALLSYASLERCVPGTDTERSVSLREAWERYRALPAPTDHTAVKAGELLKRMAETRRFQSAQLSRFRLAQDETISTQFAAVQIALEDGTVYLSYRGTDETITGWREDFRIGSEITPAQKMAADYLQQAIRPGVRYRVGGHSKGGNLAEYAALRCPEKLRGQIMEVWCNDSPGLCRELVSERELETLRGKLIRIRPGYSIIGTLFLYGQPGIIVESSGDGVLQHDGFTWCTEGDRFCRKDEPDPDSVLLVNTLEQWIGSTNLKQRRAFARDLFDALEANGAKTMPEVASGGLDGFGTVLLSLATSEKRTKITVRKFFRSFVRNCTKIDLCRAIKDKKTGQGMLLALLGLFFVTFSGQALSVVGIAAGLALFLWSVRKLYLLVLRPPKDIALRKKRFALYLAALCVGGGCVMLRNAAALSVQFLFAAVLLVFAYRNLRAGLSVQDSLIHRVCRWIVSAVSAGLGIAAAGLAGHNMTWYMLILGGALLLYGVVSVVRALYRSGGRACTPA